MDFHQTLRICLTQENVELIGFWRVYGFSWQYFSALGSQNYMIVLTLDSISWVLYIVTFEVVH